MDIRDATRFDAAEISDFVSSLAAEHIACTLGDGGLAKLIESMDCESTAQRIEEGWLHLYSMIDDRLAAVAVVKPPSHLYHLFVRTDLQRSGIGRALFHVADNRVFAATSRRIATVNSSLNAVEAYTRMGFVVKGEVEDQDGVRYQPMVRKIDT